ncbi:MAG: hypothetical protein A2666_05670 [Parcubacteria group bacterium RIFCSPHIGHO2_01_FULL_47_10b]|nr:MAG: hypothetical protein A2666_05670 [Parcubacteria group bacterium RIFCSPHIGHO2_01_FULL_47_10b]QBM02305.1 D-inositol-3-phosphate glycosyltransferase [uncultured archaeon]
MRIAVDIRSLQEGFHSGVQEYTMQLLRALWEIDGVNDYVLFTSGRSRALPSDFLSLCDSVTSSRTGRIERIHLGVPNKVLNPLFRLPGHSIGQMLGDPDLVFHPNISLARLPVEAPYIVTVHDLSFVRHPEFFSRKRQLWHRLAGIRTQIKGAAGVIAVSQSTKDDVVELYGADEQMIQVIYSGISDSFQPRSRTTRVIDAVVRAAYQLPDRYMLSVGTIDPRKNPFALIEAFEALKQGPSGGNKSPWAGRDANFADVKLVMVGPKAWTTDDRFTRRISESIAGDDIIVTGEVPSDHRPSLYRLATVFAYPSFFEGFGFPPLEAMACGTPVISSFGSSLPEAVGDAALMVDPYRVDELVAAMREVLVSAKLRKTLVQKGKVQAARFLWDDCARITLDLFGSVAQKPSNYPQKTIDVAGKQDIQL